VEVEVWQTLNTFAVNVDYAIKVYRAGRKKPRVIDSLRWEKPVHVPGHLLHIQEDGGFHREELPALEEALIASLIPFSRWDFSRHFRGCSWFWLLRGPNGRPTPKAGFLEVGSHLRLAGIPLVVAALESQYPRNDRSFSYSEWMDHNKGDALRSFSSEDKDQFNEALIRRRQVFESGGPLQHWAKQPAVITSFLEGSPTWADEPVLFTDANLVDTTEDEDLIALHSILLPAGIVEWSPLEARSKNLDLLRFFGGAQVDVRGPQAPRPAAHRLFVPAGEATELRQQYLYATLLHGISLVGQNGRTQDWRRWFCELAKSALELGLNRTAFAAHFGQLVEDACGLAIAVEKKTVYLSRAEILTLIPGPIYFGNLFQDLFRSDPVNQLLCDVTDLRWHERVEVDLSSLPIVRAKK
jgi:hypothetical protein